jgi:hypothetical protein
VSARWIVIRVGFSSPMPIHSKIVRGMRLTLASKSQRAFLMDTFLRMQAIVIFSGSSSLGGIVPLRITLQFRFSCALLHSSRLRLLESISFRNMRRVGICASALVKGMVI